MFEENTSFYKETDNCYAYLGSTNGLPNYVPGIEDEPVPFRKMRALAKKEITKFFASCKNYEEATLRIANDPEVFESGNLYLNYCVVYASGGKIRYAVRYY